MNDIKETEIIECKECGVKYKISKRLTNKWCDQCDSYVKRRIPTDQYWRLRGKVLNLVYEHGPIEKDRIKDLVASYATPKWIEKVTGQPVNENNEQLKHETEYVIYQLSVEGLIKYSYFKSSGGLDLSSWKSGFVSQKWEQDNTDEYYTGADIVKTVIITTLVIILIMAIIL